MSINHNWKVIFLDINGDESLFSVSDYISEVRALAWKLSQSTSAGGVVGLIYKTEPTLLVSWFASIMAGLRPLIIQYPTRKLSGEYWQRSVVNTISVANVRLIVADDYTRLLLLNRVAIDVISATDPVGSDGQNETSDIPTRFDIVQMSSGTTGHRKAIEFSSESLERHICDYNDKLELNGRDCIVSWLPLYHDMGYIACFIMPMLLNLPLVLIDPLTWVENPDLLYTAILRHGGTTCYMPNFGFEIMSRVVNNGLPSMTRWISCSEPVSKTTSLRFIKAVGCPESAFHPCYAMAENVFAVSIGRGLSSSTLNGVEVVSCGSPIRGVEIKVVEGEIFVRSPTSINSYIGGMEVRTNDGFYATGDMGEIVDGQLHVSGRVQDIIIQAGRKFFLSDIDLAVSEVTSEFKGRAAAVSTFDQRIGTEIPLIIAETENFLTRDDDGKIADAVARLTGVEQLSLVFAPPRFITKTSSGKINRRQTASNWLNRNKSSGSPYLKFDPCDELRLTFKNFDWDKPVAEILNSLSMTILRMLSDNASVAIRPFLSFNQLLCRF